VFRKKPTKYFSPMGIKLVILETSRSVGATGPQGSLSAQSVLIPEKCSCHNHRNVRDVQFVNLKKIKKKILIFFH